MLYTDISVWAMPVVVGTLFAINTYNHLANCSITVEPLVIGRFNATWIGDVDCAVRRRLEEVI